MPDTYGALQIPIQLAAPGQEITDPAVSLIVNYLAAILNVYALAAWRQVFPVTSGMVGAELPSLPVIKTYGHNPAEESFEERTLPALFLWRGPQGARPVWLAEDWRVSTDQWTLLWLLPTGEQQARKLRQSFINGIAKLVDRAIEQQRDPVYVAPADVVPTASGADPTAATTLPVTNAIKLAVASSTSPQHYTGAALDGAIGGAATVPAQLPTVTVTGSGSAGTVSFVGIGQDGAVRTSRVDVSGTGTFYGDWALQQVTAIDVPAQPDTAATLSWGLNGFVGLGSEVFVLGRFVMIEVGGWAEKVMTIKMADTSPLRSYEGIQIMLNVEERWIRDTSALDPDAVQSQYTDSTDNAYVRETSLFT